MIWPHVRLGNVADIQLGKMLSPKARTGVSSFPYLRNVNVQWGRLDLSDLVEMDFDEEAQTKFSLKRGDLLVCEGGEPGRSAVVDKDLPGIFFQKALMRVRPHHGQMDTGFLQRFMEFAANRGTFAKDGNQATIAHFPAVKLNALEVPCPPLPEQRRIADILDKADAIRRKRKEAIALTEELLRSAFLEMFGDPVTNPKGWPRATVDDVCSRIVDCPHTTPTYEGSSWPHPCVRTSDLQAGFFDWSSTKYVSENEYLTRITRLRPEPGDVFYTREGERYGIAAMLPRGVMACLGQRMMLLRVNPEVATPEFLWASMNSSGVYRQATAEVGGSTSPHVNVKTIRRFQITRPPLALQRKFSLACAAATRARDTQLLASDEARTLFSALVHRAFRGELTGTNGAGKPQLGLFEAGR